MSLSDVQLAADRRRLGTAPALLRRKWTRMAASPFAFLRGASALWAAALDQHPGLLRGLPGAGTLVGDLHLENFGTYRTTRGVTLHVNDFDETFEGPWCFDVLRLLTSTLLARPELGCTGLEALNLADALLDGHAAGLAGETTERLPAALSRVVQAAAAKPEDKVLVKRLAAPDRLVRDEKTPAAPAGLRPQVKQAVETWSVATGQREATHVLDYTRRVAGTGSLGVERVLALVRTGARARLLELKEVRGSSFASTPADAQALLGAWERCVPRPPREVAAALLGRLPIIVRPVFASDEKVSVEDFDRAALPQTLRTLGVLSGEVHRRGAKGRRVKWTAAHRRALLDRGADLAGLHEQAFVAFCLEAWETLER